MGIIFPPNPRKQIFLSDDARNLISQAAESGLSDQDNGHAKLTVAYEKMWNKNSELHHKALQPRLFHLVLSAFDDLTLYQLTEALRIDPEGKKAYQTELQPEHIEWLCHNFLIKTSTAGLGWAHKSAKDFVTLDMMDGNRPVFSKVSNHIYMSQIALQLIADINHPAWKAGGLDLPYWRQHRSSKRETGATDLDVKETICTIQTAFERVTAEHDIKSIEDNQPEAFVRGKMPHELQSREFMRRLMPLFGIVSFAS